jgi:hypothetical protein
LRSADADQNILHYCCYKDGGIGNQGGLEPLISGFARIITYSSYYGIEDFEEGHFKNGKQDRFGRVFKIEEAKTR